MEELIFSLNQSQISILFIDDCYYAVENFAATDKSVSYHKLIGKNITNILEKFKMKGIQGNNALEILQEIEKTPTREIQFSGNYSYKWFVK